MASSLFLEAVVVFWPARTLHGEDGSPPKEDTSRFNEKPQTSEGWINGGFFVFNSGVFDYLDGDATVLEGSVLKRLACDGELMAYRHSGFWQCMDTLRDKLRLEELWQSGAAPWKVWEGNDV